MLLTLLSPALLPLPHYYALSNRPFICTSSLPVTTVFSHESKIDFIARAKALGYKIILVYIHLMESSLNEARVHQLVTEGGHNVPSDKIYSRIPRTMENIKTALTLVDEAWILDNSSEKDRFKQIAVMKYGRYEIKADPIPDWAKAILPVEIK